ncbi:hypothetical protein SASPL_116351 [Salvia splendens]|uniref:Uncharacterized protein n=1 Tax=Salvia splendens TaxID=180675 RepID=A0A8X8XVI2_SALSN|nr:uncharacterized protein LOC121807887 [Salvia splendens]KAG6419839.1 hypothetical protein SASPL_116351 [Salvia splendens]
MAEDAVEDFTFPATIANPPPCLLESPPLWPAFAKHGQEDEWSFNLCDSFHEFKRNTITFRENFCYVNDDDDDDCKEEKMDVLWEDLNDKFSKKRDSSEDSNSPGRDDHVRVCCVRTLKLSKGNTISWKKASILVLIRFLLKKGFAMHDSAPSASIKKLEW